MNKKIDLEKNIRKKSRYASNSAVIIGSGFGGLATGIRLQAKGYKTKIFERLDQPGGRASVFKQDGFTFDAGPTIVTAPFLLEELWELAGKKFSNAVDLRRMDPFYRIRFDDGSYFDYSGDHEKMKGEIAKIAPDEVSAYDSFMHEAEKCYSLGYEQLGNFPYNSVKDLFDSVPSMIKMRAWQSIYQMVSKFFMNDKLRRVFSFHPLLIGGNPMAVTCVYSLIAALERKYGVHSAMGGTTSIISEMVKLFEQLGGELVLNSQVSKINIENRKVLGLTLQNGTVVDSEIVISNADTAWTYQNLIDGEHRKTWTNKKLSQSKYSMSLYVWYFGTKKKYDDVLHHTILLGPKNKSLLKNIFKLKSLSKEFSLYLHRPTATDPSLAPEGCDSFYVLSPVPNLEGNIDWTCIVENYKSSILEYLEGSILPGLGKHIISERQMTPYDFRDRYLAYNGAAFGMEPVLTQSAWFRPHNKSEDIEGLFFVGAGTHPGAGIPGVLTSAKLLDQVIPKPEKVTAEQGQFIPRRTVYEY